MRLRRVLRRLVEEWQPLPSSQLRQEQQHAAALLPLGLVRQERQRLARVRLQLERLALRVPRQSQVRPPLVLLPLERLEPRWQSPEPLRGRPGRRRQVQQPGPGPQGLPEEGPRRQEPLLALPPQELQLEQRRREPQSAERRGPRPQRAAELLPPERQPPQSEQRHWAAATLHSEERP